MKVVFYGNKHGNFFDKAIRWWTSSAKDKLNGKWRDSFSHVELLFSDEMMFSASQYKNATRFEIHSLTSKAWVRVDVDVSFWEEEIIREWCESIAGKKYDYFGVVGFVFGLRHQREKWFCSEVCTAALQRVGMCDFIEPHHVSPNKLYRLLYFNKGR